MATPPMNLPPLAPKVTADNGATFAGLLQPKHQAAFLADATDLPTAITRITAIIDVLIASGLMKSA